MKKHTEIYPEIIETWRDLYQDFWKHFEECFHYKNTQSHAERYIRALLARVERKNGWQMAEYLGEKSPHAIQNFLEHFYFKFLYNRRMKTILRHLSE